MDANEYNREKVKISIKFLVGVGVSTVVAFGSILSPKIFDNPYEKRGDLEEYEQLLSERNKWAQDVHYLNGVKDGLERLAYIPEGAAKTSETLSELNHWPEENQTALFLRTLEHGDETAARLDSLASSYSDSLTHTEQRISKVGESEGVRNYHRWSTLSKLLSIAGALAGMGGIFGSLAWSMHAGNRLREKY